MPRYFFNTEYLDAKSLPILANSGLLQQTAGGNTQPPFLCIKEVLQRSMSAACQNYTQLSKPVTRPEYGMVGINRLKKI